jgi:hypothetical protein
MSTGPRCLSQPEKSAVAEYSIDRDHRIDLDGPSKLGKATRKIDCVVKEAIEIRLHPNNINRDEGFNLIHTWRLGLEARQWARKDKLR